MDKNFERNLIKIEGMRTKGELAKARRKLAELVQDHPDTPDYRLELARVCLELGDSRAGLLELRHLLRRQPARRAELFAVVEAHFQATADPYAAQFLLEDHIGRADGDGALLVLERLTEAQIEQLRERFAARLENIGGQSEDGEPQPVRLARWGGLFCALALKRHEEAADHAVWLLRNDEQGGKVLMALLERRSRSTQVPPPLLAVLGEARVREGRTLDGLSALLGAAERDRASLPRIEAILELLAPQLGAAPAALRARGHLARLAGRHDAAIARYREAVASDPQGIRSLLELITPAKDGPETKPYTLLRLELLARAGDGAVLASALEQLRQAAWIEPGELRAAIAPGLAASPPDPSLIVAAAMLAARSGDTAGLEELLPACAGLPRDLQASVARAVASRLGQRPAAEEMVTDPITGEQVRAERDPQEATADLAPQERVTWLRLLARLQAAVGDAAGANASLAALWGQSPPDADLLPFTREILASVPPAASMLSAALPAAAGRGELQVLLPWFAAVPYDDPEAQRAVEDTLTALALQDAAHARALCEGNTPARGPLALPLAVARLRAGDAQRGLRELSALVATRPDLEGRELEILLACCGGTDAPADLALAAARALRLEGRLDEAAAVLRPAFEHDPSRAEEICLFYESLLADEPERSGIWLAYLDGLLRAGRWRRLAQLLPEAEARLPAAEIGRLRVYRARLLFEGGELEGALSECELVLQLADPPLDLLQELLRSTLAVNPGLGRAHRLLGAAAFAGDRFEEGLRCCAQALRCEPALQTEILHTVRRLAEKRVRNASSCLALARFYLDCGRGDDAAASYQEALQADPGSAAAVAADLHDAAAQDAPFGSLLQPLAQALRLAGRLDEAETAYTALYARDRSRVEWIFRELAQLEGAAPEAPQPLRARARILLAEKRASDLERLLTAALERRDRAELRWQLAREFVAAFAQSPAVPLLAAAAAADTGHREHALKWLRDWAARRDRLDGRDYERALAVLAALGEERGEWIEREARCRVHLLGGRPDLALAALPGPTGLDDEQLAFGWASLEALPAPLREAREARLQRARYLAALGRPEQVLAELAGPAPDDGAPAELRREAAALRTQALAALGRHEEALQSIREMLRAPEAQEEALAVLRLTHAAEAESLTASRGGSAALTPEDRREVASRLAHAGRVAEGLRLLAEPCSEPAQEQARRVAEAQLLALDDRPMEALERLRAVPLTGEACLLAPAARAAALWLRAHGEEARGGWAAACACYRALGALPGDPESARRWWSWSYGRLLEESVSGTSLVLEKTATLV